MNSFAVYKPRKVEFYRLEETNDWNIKVYTITCRNAFESKGVLENVIENLPILLERSKLLGFETYKAAFLIVHEGRDGIWSLLNWWIGGEMLQSTTFYTDFNKPSKIQTRPKEGFMACVWEMAVISFERKMWIEHILKKAKNPDFTGYLGKYLSKEV